MTEADFKPIYIQYFQAMCFYAQRITHDQDAAKDLCEDVFCWLWEKGDLTKISDLRGYLYRTVHNACLAHQKKETRLRKLAGDVSLQAYNFFNADQEKIRAESIRQLEIAMKELPPQFGEVIELYFIKNQRNKEIAHQLNISQSTVERHKATALHMLRRLLSKPLLLLIIWL